MFIRNGIKSILRERGRTALFSLLIILLTITLIMSLSVLLYSKAVMAACDASYRSIATVKYMGAEYPNEDEPDADARAVAAELTEEAMLNIPGVTAWTSGSTSFASIEGYERRFGTMPNKNKAVIVVSQVSQPIEQWARFDAFNNPIVEEGFITYYTCILKSTLYSRSGKEGTYIDILTGDTDFVPEKGKSYILNGSFVDTSGTAHNIGDYPKNGYLIFRVESFTSADSLPYADYTEETGIPETFLRAAEQYKTINNYIRVVPCRDVNDVYSFHQNELQLVEGTMPNPEVPYSCVISNDLAVQLKLKPGDTISLDTLRGTAEDRYQLHSSGESQTFTVSGIAADSPDYKGIIWVIDGNADTPLFGYLLGTVSLHNEEAQAAVETLQSILPEQVQVTLLDQGYSSAVYPFREIEKTAINVLLVCSVGIVAILLLFAFLYVGRQHAAVKIMVSMGTPRCKIALWFLSGALVICGISAILGTVLGTALRPTVLRMISEIADQNSADGFLRYSETVLGIVKQMTFDPQVPLWPNLLAVPAIVVLALLFCLWFLRMAHRGGTRKRGSSKVRMPRGKSSVLGLRGLGFSLLSIRRGGLRSLVVPLVSLVLTVTILILGGVYQQWQNKLDDALENTRIEGIAVSLDGRYYSDLVIPIYNLRTLLGVEGIDNVSVSYGYQYWLPEDEPGFTQGSFGQEHRQEWIAVQPELVALNSLSAAKEFYYTDAAITWLDGWDESALAEADFTPLRNRSEEKAEERLIPAVCSDAFLDAHNLVLGDTFTCFAQVERNMDLKEIPLKLQVIGSYVQQGGKAHTYIPLACHVPLSLMNVDEDPSNIREYSRFTFRTCRFQLSSAAELDTVRQRLYDEGFSAVGHISSNRTTLLLRDAAFLKLVKNMQRNIAMGKVMSTVLSLLMVLLGFIVSWLMIFSRRREFALMRGFGVKKRRIFASFFLEQAILSLTGCLVGCAVLFWLYAGGMVQPLAAAGYLVCYLLGAAISIRMIGKTDLMQLLAVRE